MAKALPNYDRDHVYPSDMKKLVQWYNILIENGITDFEAPQEEAE
jgi:dephospho-CoA kinase